MNRSQRRKYEGLTGKHSPLNLREFMGSDRVARCNETWEVIWRAIELRELEKKRNRPWNRLQRWLQGLFGGQIAVIDPQTGDEEA